MPNTETGSLAGLPILGFDDASALEGWLTAEPRSSDGIWLRLAKKESAVKGVRKPEAIDAALCHGWIDGQQKPYDAESWLVRFTPRRRASRWSEINRARSLELIAEGRMRPTGLAEVEAAQADGRWQAAYAPASTAQVPADLQSALDANPEASAFFATLTGANRYAVLYRIQNVKRAETRARKIAEFTAMLARNETIYS